jgi:hypothetical protein
MVSATARTLYDCQRSKRRAHAQFVHYCALFGYPASSSSLYCRGIGGVRPARAVEPSADIEPTDHRCIEDFARCVCNIARGIGDPVSAVRTARGRAVVNRGLISKGTGT